MGTWKATEPTSKSTVAFRRLFSWCHFVLDPTGPVTRAKFVLYLGALLGALTILTLKLSELEAGSATRLHLEDWRTYASLVGAGVLAYMVQGRTQYVTARASLAARIASLETSIANRAGDPALDTPEGLTEWYGSTRGTWTALGVELDLAGVGNYSASTKFVQALFDVVPEQRELVEIIQTAEGRTGWIKTVQGHLVGIINEIARHP